VAIHLTTSNIYVSSLLSTVEWLDHGFGTSTGSPVGHESVASLNQIHSDIIHRISFEGDKQANGDGLFTSQPDLWISIRTADCIPILLVDPNNHVVAAVHAGWRGTVDRIVLKTVERLKRECHSNPKELLVAIGPGISECCFEVGEEVASRFETTFVTTQLAGKAKIDLKKANLEQLLMAGVQAANVEVSEACTVSTLGFHSYRRDKTEGRMISAIRIKKGAA
jgi:polyphenol oxidase